MYSESFGTLFKFLRNIDRENWKPIIEAMHTNILPDTIQGNGNIETEPTNSEDETFDRQLVAYENEPIDEVPYNFVLKMLDETVISSQISNCSSYHHRHASTITDLHTHRFFINNFMDNKESTIQSSNINIVNHNSSHDDFTPFFCVDSGEPRSVIGQTELNQINRNFNSCRKLSPSRFSFRFVDKI